MKKLVGLHWVHSFYVHACFHLLNCNVAEIETVSKIESTVTRGMSLLWLVRTKMLINMEKTHFIACHSVMSHLGHSVNHSLVFIIPVPSYKADLLKNP